MKKNIRYYLLTLISLAASFTTFCQNTPQIKIENSTWVVTDAIGRTLPTYNQSGPSKQNRYVGLFYWLWHGKIRSNATNPDSINVTKILSADPAKTDWRAEDYYWDESEFGYYRSADAWVMKRHLALIAAAGVDFIFLDLTNGEIYEPELTLLLQTIQQMRKQGINAPSVVLFLSADYGWKVKKLYEDFYKQGKYNDVWFYRQGKPLIMSPKVTGSQFTDGTLLAEILGHFTWRPTWALFNDDNGPGGKWRFMDLHPQKPALDSAGNIEQYVVSKSMGAPLWNWKINCSSCGLHFVPKVDKYWMAKETGTGIFFSEQWDRADSVKAPILLVTGWNELKAGAWPTNRELADDKNFAFENKKMHKGDLYFVDEFNREFNRDIEPIKNGYTDNFYYQFVSRIRKYKGMEAPQPASPPKTIQLDKFSEWETVTPIYTNTLLDADHRDFDGVLPGLHYANTTGRNHIVESRVTHDAKYLYFYVKTSSAITPCTDKNWMLLFIDADNNKKTGWEGYDYAINTEVKNKQETSLKKRVNGAWKMVAIIKYAVNNNEMALKIPLSALKKQQNKLTFNFHWADNIQKLNDISEFFIDGDSAPLRRFNYFYTNQK